MNIKYIIGSLISLPLLPILYFQGKRVKREVPELPEAKGPNGLYLTKTITNQTLNIITIGESTIAGVGVEKHEEGFTGSLAKELSSHYKANVRWNVYARSGYTAAAVSKKLVPRIEEQSLDLIVIGLGANDAFGLNSPKKWSMDIHHLIKKLQSKFSNTPIVFCNMPPIKEFPAFTKLMKFVIGNLVELLGKELESIVLQYNNVHYNSERITLNTWMKRFNLTKETSAFFSDGVHPSKLTYQIWAKDVALSVSRYNMIKS